MHLHNVVTTCSKLLGNPSSLETRKNSADNIDWSSHSSELMEARVGGGIPHTTILRPTAVDQCERLMVVGDENGHLVVTENNSNGSKVCLTFVTQIKICTGTSLDNTHTLPLCPIIMDAGKPVNLPNNRLTGNFFR